MVYEKNPWPKQKLHLHLCSTISISIKTPLNTGVSLAHIMMKGFGFWILFFLFGTALLFLYFSPISDSDLARHDNTIGLTKPSRKLKENNNIHDENGYGNVDADDYLPNDPVPSSKAAALRPGPIEHGTPLMPYIPKPSAPPGPNDPRYDGFP